MLSGIGEHRHLLDNGIAVQHALPGVGMHLHDHPDVVQVVNAPQLKDLFGISLTGAWRALQGVLEWRRHRTGLLTTNFAEAGGFIRARRTSRSGPAAALRRRQAGRPRAQTVFGHGLPGHVCVLRPVRAAAACGCRAGSDDAAADRPELPRRARRASLRGFKILRRILSQLWPVTAARGGRLRVGGRIWRSAVHPHHADSRSITRWAPHGPALDVVALGRCTACDLRVVDASSCRASSSATRVGADGHDPGGSTPVTSRTKRRIDQTFPRVAPRSSIRGRPCGRSNGATLGSTSTGRPVGTGCRMSAPGDRHQPHGSSG